MSLGVLYDSVLQQWLSVTHSVTQLLSDKGTYRAVRGQLKTCLLFRDWGQFCQTASGQMTCFQEAIRLAAAKWGWQDFLSKLSNQPMEMFSAPAETNLGSFIVM